MLARLPSSAIASDGRSIEDAVEELLDAVESLGPISGCTAMHAAHLVIAAGANHRQLIAAGIDAAGEYHEPSRVRLFRDYRRFLREHAQ